MKKLVIFLIPLIVSIPTFAQDESLLPENFSLVKYSGANNRKVFKIDIFSERTPLSRIATVENRNQKRGNRYNLIYELQEDINSEKKSESLAEGYLRRFAERNKKRRKIGGITMLVMGGGLMVLGDSWVSKEEEGWSLIGYLSIITGAGAVVAGVFTLAVPSRAERKYKNALKISDSAQRERASHEALSSFAARARRNRILTGILSAVYSVVSLGEAEESLEYAYAASLAASAVYSFVVKSPAERAFQNYLKERELRKKLEFRLGIGPYGGVKIGFVYSF